MIFPVAHKADGNVPVRCRARLSFQFEYWLSGNFGLTTLGFNTLHSRTNYAFGAKGGQVFIHQFYIENQQHAILNVIKVRLLDCCIR